MSLCESLALDRTSTASPPAGVDEPRLWECAVYEEADTRDCLLGTSTSDKGTEAERHWAELDVKRLVDDLRRLLITKFPLPSSISSLLQ
jgi:hypothetical protein